MYNLYQYQCDWYAHTVWETLKRLFPDCHEMTESGGRSPYLRVKVDEVDSVEVVCKEYHTQWACIENAVEERRRAKETEARQLRMERRTEGRAQHQAEIDQATRDKKEAVKKAEEAARKLEEMRAEWQAEIDQMDRMRAQYGRQVA
jgi:hypothetical protein